MEDGASKKYARNVLNVHQSNSDGDYLPGICEKAVMIQYFNPLLITLDGKGKEGKKLCSGEEVFSSLGLIIL